MTAAEGKKLLDQATKAGIVHAVTFNYRGNPLVQQARLAIARGDIGKPHFLRRLLPAGLAPQGHRLLVAARARQGRRLVGARRHRIALVRPGAARQRPEDHARARRHHDRDPEAQEAEGLARGVCRRGCESGLRGSGHQGRGSGVRAGALRQRREGQLLGRPGVRGAQERLPARGLRVDRRRCAGGRNSRTSSGSAIGTSRTSSWRRIRRCSTRKRAAMRTCPEATRNRGPTRSRT